MCSRLRSSLEPPAPASTRERWCRRSGLTNTPSPAASRQGLSSGCRGIPTPTTPIHRFKPCCCAASHGRERGRWMNWSISSLLCARRRAHMGAASSVLFPRLILAALLASTVCNAQTSEAPHPWPAESHTYIIKNFRFGSGETLPELKLHYLTLGLRHTDAAG